MTDKLEKILMTGMIIFLTMVGLSLYSCDRLTHKESQSYNEKESSREAEYMEDCLKSLPKYECIYRWQSAIKNIGK